MRQALHWLTVIFLGDALISWWLEGQPFFQIVTTVPKKELSVSVTVFFFGLSLICLAWSGWLRWRRR